MGMQNPKLANNMLLFLGSLRVQPDEVLGFQDIRMSINVPGHMLPTKDFHPKVEITVLSHLGIIMGRKTSCLYTLNYISLIREITLELEK